MFEFPGTRAAREQSELVDDLEAYRDMAIDITADERLRLIDSSATVHSLQIITSNDRHQFAAAHLEVAHTRFVVARSLYDQAITADARDEAKSGYLDYGQTSAYLHKLFDTAHDESEAAGLIWTNTGYKATAEDESALLTAAVTLPLPESIADSKLMLKGGTAALDTLALSAFTRYNSTIENPLLAPGFMMSLRKQAGPLMSRIDAKWQAIKESAPEGIDEIHNPRVLQKILADLNDALAAVDELNIWMTVPRLRDEKFTLSAPLDEERPNRRLFHPDDLGAPAVRQQVVVEPVRPSPRPDRPRREFKPSDLDRPQAVQESGTDSADKPTRPRRTFDPRDLDPPVRKPDDQPRRPKRTFDPSHLDVRPAKTSAGDETGQAQPPRRKKKEFDPSDLDRRVAPESESTEADQPPRRKKKVFHPDDLDPKKHRNQD